MGGMVKKSGPPLDFGGWEWGWGLGVERWSFSRNLLFPVEQETGFWVLNFGRAGLAAREFHLARLVFWSSKKNEKVRIDN